jgi:hypothetical protein
MLVGSVNQPVTMLVGPPVMPFWRAVLGYQELGKQLW